MNSSPDPPACSRPSCLIVDDEPVARRGLAEDLAAMGLVSVEGMAADAIQARVLLEAAPVDILFLDIEMPGINGLEFLRGLRTKPLVILVTAWPQYALNGYEYGVVDYIVKPVPLERLRAACEKAVEQHRLRRGGERRHQDPGSGYPLPGSDQLTPGSGAPNLGSGQLFPGSGQHQPQAGSGQTHLFLKVDGAYERVAVADILYVEAANNYIRVHTAHRKLMIYLSLKGMEEQLPPGNFIQVHKSFLVAK
ncbi:MAG TPA: LytTR family DNA-binding domain-containing protein, partial [Puia sp.]|nr:LytTR family DNA-binding domain-containing protein [Puia sp.]